MTTSPRRAPCGTWKSPVTADALTQTSVTLEGLLVDAVTNDIYHLERRASEAGRSVIVDTKNQKDVVDQTWNVRTGVHEYGGGAATVSNGVVFFSHYGDGRVYRTQGGTPGPPEPVTPENTNWRYAELTVVSTRPAILIAVLEDHTNPNPASVINKLVVIDTTSQSIVTIAEGADFYASPGVSPDGSKISWIQWHHPDMPWEGSELLVADIHLSQSPLAVTNPKVVAGRKGEVSVFQARWASSETLIFLNDISGFINPWKYSPVSSKAEPISSDPLAEDFADPGPPRTLGRSDYAILDSDTMLFSSIRGGFSVLYLAELRSHSFRALSTPYTVITHLQAVSFQEATFIGRNDDNCDAIVRLTLSTGGEPTYNVARSPPSNPSLPQDLISKGRSYALSTAPSSEPIHVLFYPPFSPDFAPLDNEMPPAIISIHGGPTGRALPGLAWEKQFWTTRGWAWVDVDHGGSSGYGRKYRERLNGNWGIVDVNDTVEAVKQLGNLGLIDPKRMAIRGGSAGGYTALASLVNRPKVFSAATSLYGVSNLVKLAEHSHKFESRYLEKLIGGTPQEIPEVYKDRSPISHADKIEAPLLILQGSIDAIIPPPQAEEILEKIKQKGGHVKYILFEGEGHGWRKAESIKQGLEEELAWYKNILGLV